MAPRINIVGHSPTKMRQSKTRHKGGACQADLPAFLQMCPALWATRSPVVRRPVVLMSARFPVSILPRVITELRRIL